MSAFRIFSRFAELLDINVTRAAAAWLRLNADGTVTERTAAQVLSDIGGAASSHEHTSAQISDATDAATPYMVVKRSASGSAAFDNYISAPTVLVGDTLTVGGMGAVRASNLTSGQGIELPNASGTLALTTQTDGKIKSADIDDATDDGDRNKGKVLKTSDSGEVLVAGLTTGALAVGFAEDEAKGNLILSSATTGRILSLPDASGTLALTNSSTGLVNVDAGYVTGTLPVANGGTGAATAPLARAALGITEYGDPVVTATSKGAAQSAIGIVNMTPAAYTALVAAGTVDATTLYLLTE